MKRYLLPTSRPERWLTRRPRCRALVVALLACWPGGCTPRQDLSSYSDGPAAFTSTDGDAPAAAGGSSSAPAPVEPDLDTAFTALDASTPPAAGGDERDDLGEVADAGGPSTLLSCNAPGELAAEEGRCYLRGAQVVSWSSASAACVAWGGALVRIEGPEEEALLLGDAAGDAWIGLNDIEAEGAMRWDGGGELGAFAHWAPEQPDDFDGSEDCVELLADGRGYNDRPCTDLRAYLCER